MKVTGTSGKIERTPSETTMLLRLLDDATPSNPKSIDRNNRRFAEIRFVTFDPPVLLRFMQMKNGPISVRFSLVAIAFLTMLPKQTH
jgi:hypothetical protein